MKKLQYLIFIGFVCLIGGCKKETAKLPDSAVVVVVEDQKYVQVSEENKITKDGTTFGIPALYYKVGDETNKLYMFSLDKRYMIPMGK